MVKSNGFISLKTTVASSWFLLQSKKRRFAASQLPNSSQAICLIFGGTGSHTSSMGRNISSPLGTLVPDRVVRPWVAPDRVVRPWVVPDCVVRPWVAPLTDCRP